MNLDQYPTPRTDTPSKRKIYCFNAGGEPRFLHAMAVADDGHHLASHCCSHEGYMRHDLGMDGSTWKHEKYNQHFGEGNWELEWVADTKTHAGFLEAARLNRLLAATEETK